MTKQLKSIAVIGGGIMGQGIAQVCAAAGFSVKLFDVQPELTARAMGTIRKKVEAAVAKGKITAEQKDLIIGNIEPANDFRLLLVDLAIEAVVEKLEIKQKIFLELEKLNGKDCILVSNTSSLSVTQIASILKHQERVAGLHFFNPAPAMKLVEVIAGAATSAETIDALFQFTDTLSKASVLVKDAPGFIVNRVARPFYVEALKVLEENVTSHQTVDALIKNAGFKMGPFELMDMIGLDVNFAVTSSLYESFKQEPKFRPSRIQQQKIDAGHLGIKSGKGFYDYPQQ